MSENDPLQKAREQIVNGYLEVIKVNYLTLPQSSQRRLLKDLEVLVTRYENLAENPQISFDYEHARRIREGLDLSLQDLAGKLDMSSHSSICRIELGKATDTFLRKVAKIAKSDSPTKKYLKWLKEQGYNPFNL